MEKICPHFHLSLQSGCDATLKRMNRKYTAEEYEEGMQTIYGNILRIRQSQRMLLWDFLEKQKKNLHNEGILKRIHFYEMHIFKYSKRKGTRAAVMEHQVPEEMKTEAQCPAAGTVAESMSKDSARIMLEEEEVLFEEPMEIDGETYILGYTKEYVKIADKNGRKPLDNVMKRGRVEAALTDEIYRMKL